eukprot:COSAG02_NODE_7792_length_2843_cov_2.179300_3_plen_46_part_00
MHRLHKGRLQGTPGRLRGNHNFDGLRLEKLLATMNAPYINQFKIV